MNPNPHFVRGIQANLLYWGRRVSDAAENRMDELEQERENLYQAVRYGLGVLQTSEQATELALQLFDLVDNGSYWQDWIPVMNLALRQERKPHPWMEAKLRNRLGQLYRRSHDFAAARAEHRRALTIATSARDEQARAEALLELAHVDYEQRNYAAAEEHGLEALRIFQQLEAAPKWVAGAYDILGTVAQARADFAVAQERLTLAVAMWRRARRPLDATRILVVLGNTYWYQGELEKALACMQEADERLSNTNSEMDKTNLYLALGTLYDSLERPNEAEQVFRRVNTLYLQQTENWSLQGNWLVNMGTVLLKLEQLDEAEAALRDAIALYERMDDPGQLGNAQGTLAGVLVARGDRVAAVNLYNQAIENLEQVAETAIGQYILPRFRDRRRRLLDE
ncbi:MAG: tetratricopeptide repeat protein [Anaerolineales bacterium]|nr:tetratricopeptide repeat protein [Anaerolineales bacterium]MCB8954529.1 tetratricopeptide repeat protein [Ardenticatenales bacterium]